MWDLLRPGMKPTSLIWAARLFTLEPPGKPLTLFIITQWLLFLEIIFTEVTARRGYSQFIILSSLMVGALLLYKAILSSTSLFTPSFTLYQHGLMDSHLIQWVITDCYCLFCCSNCPFKVFSLLPCHAQISFNPFLSFWDHTEFQLHSIRVLLWNHPFFFQGVLVLFSGAQHLETKIRMLSMGPPWWLSQ